MSLPAWNDPELNVGTMIRGALWLIQEIGEGNTFTKEQLREAFPGVAQADRRLRDLRAYKWIILTNAEDATLMAEDQRFMTAGVPVWDPAARRAAAPHSAVSAKEKQAVMARDDYMCSVCGISGGEPYADDSHQTAVLVVARRQTILPDGREQLRLVTECKVCRAGSNGIPVRADEVLRDIKALEAIDQRTLARWIARGRRDSSPLERAWNSYRRLPADARDEVRSALERD